MYSIRKGSPRDSTAISELVQTVFRDSYGPQLDEQTLSEHVQSYLSPQAVAADMAKANYLLCEAHCALLGVLKLVRDEAGSEAEIETLYVRAEAQGLGVGSRLMQEALEWAQREQVARLWLKVWRENTRAITFYQTHAFDIYATCKVYVAEVVFHDWLMERTL